MKLEQEAKAHVEGTRIKFYDELAQHAEALEHLIATVLWARHCVKKHGVQ